MPALAARTLGLVAAAVAVTAATFRAHSVVEGMLAYLAYAAGVALVVGLLAGGIALAGAPESAWLRCWRRSLCSGSSWWRSGAAGLDSAKRGRGHSAHGFRPMSRPHRFR